MIDLVRSIAMLLAACFIVLFFSLVAPSREEKMQDVQNISAYENAYSLQDLVLTNDITEDSGLYRDLMGNVNYCQSN